MKKFFLPNPGDTRRNSLLKKNKSHLFLDFMSSFCTSLINRKIQGVTEIAPTFLNCHLSDASGLWQVVMIAPSSPFFSSF